MKDNLTKGHVPPTKGPGLHNDFSEQEETMTASAMPPTFALDASGAATNPGAAKVSDAKPAPKAKVNVSGVPPELVILLQFHEGIKLKVYDDGYGNITGGMGHLLSAAEIKQYPIDAPLSQATIDAWANKDVNDAWQAAQKQATELGLDDHDFKVALASMSFQNGVYWYKKHVATWALMREQKWEAAAVEAANSDWARQTPPRLVDFQNALRKLSEGQSNIADPFRKKVAEAREMAAGGQSTVKPPATAATAIPEGKEGIRQVQTKLKELGLYAGAIDGIATSSKGESNTTKGIKKFQESRNLPVTGVVDAATWSALHGAKGAHDPSIWDKFMAKQGGESKSVASHQPKKPKDGGLAEPFRKLAAKARKDAAGAACNNGFEQGTGSFVDEKYFVTQSPDATGSIRATKPGWQNCRQAATDISINYLKGEMPEMAKELGISTIQDLERDQGYLRILEEDKSHKSEVRGEKNESHPEWLLANEQMQTALAYINEKLAQKVPVVIGVDHTFNRDLNSKNKTASKAGNGYNEGTTDHFITLTGMGQDEEGRNYYSYFDVGTSHIDKGTSSENRLVESNPGVFARPQGAGSSGNQSYYLSMVLIYKNDRKKYEKEIQKNLSDKAALMS